MLLQVVVLVGTGWSYMKPLLAKREKRILMIVIPLQARTNFLCLPGPWPRVWQCNQVLATTSDTLSKASGAIPAAG